MCGCAASTNAAGAAGGAVFGVVVVGGIMASYPLYHSPRAPQPPAGTSAESCVLSTTSSRRGGEHCSPFPRLPLRPRPRLLISTQHAALVSVAAHGRDVAAAEDPDEDQAGHEPPDMRPVGH